MAQRLALLAFGLLLAFGSGELLLRGLRPEAYLHPPDRVAAPDWQRLVHRPSATPGLAYELRPGAVGELDGIPVRINRHGMRDAEPLPDAPGLRRVAVVGDSWTFGFGVAAEDTFPWRLETLLNASYAEQGLRFDVLNLGVGGYSIHDELAVLAHKVVPWRPHLAIVAYTLNDPETQPIQPLHMYFHPTRWWQHSHLVRFLLRVELLRATRVYGGGDRIRYLHRHPPTWRRAERALREMARIGRREDLPILLVILPVIPEEGWERYPYLDLHRQVAEAAGRAGLPVLDLYAAYARHPAASLRVSAIDGHHNARGHALVARTLHDRLRELDAVAR